jgi:hypothetical protein
MHEEGYVYVLGTSESISQKNKKGEGHKLVYQPIFVWMSYETRIFDSTFSSKYGNFGLIFLIESKSEFVSNSLHVAFVVVEFPRNYRKRGVS